MRHTVLIGIALLLGAALADESEYADANRRLYFLPREAALGFSDLTFSRNGAPNTNPANMALDSTSEIALAYSGFYRNAFSTTLLSYVADLRSAGGLGVSVEYLLVPDIIDTRNWSVDSDGNPIVPATFEYASASEMYLHVAYGRGWTLGRVRLDAGVAANVLRRRLLEWTGYGIGLDGAGAVTFVRTGIRVALVMENLTTTYMNWSDNYSEHVYPHLRLGVGWRREFPYIYGAFQASYASPDLLSNEGANATTFLDANDPEEDARELTLFDDPQMLFYGNYGLEYTIAKVVSVRVGLESLRRFTFGAGVSLFKQRLTVDFAYLTHHLSGSYLAGVSWRWP